MAVRLSVGIDDRVDGLTGFCLVVTVFLSTLFCGHNTFSRKQAFSMLSTAKQRADTAVCDGQMTLLYYGVSVGPSSLRMLTNRFSSICTVRSYTANLAVFISQAHSLCLFFSFLLMK